MACEVNFYQYDDLLIRSLGPIVLKIQEEKNKVLIICQDEAQAKELDLSLWTYGRNKFIPHATSLDKNFEAKRQPVLISNIAQNLNEATYLIFLGQIDKDFIEGFNRAFYFYSDSDEEMAKRLSSELSPKNSFKKIDGKWIKS